LGNATLSLDYGSGLLLLRRFDGSQLELFDMGQEYICASNVARPVLLREFDSPNFLKTGEPINVNTWTRNSPYFVNNYHLFVHPHRLDNNPDYSSAVLSLYSLIDMGQDPTSSHKTVPPSDKLAPVLSFTTRKYGNMLSFASNSDSSCFLLAYSNGAVRWFFPTMQPPSASSIGATGFEVGNFVIEVRYLARLCLSSLPSPCLLPLPLTCLSSSSSCPQATNSLAKSRWTSQKVSFGEGFRSV
jgi:hypothetical protein